MSTLPVYLQYSSQGIGNLQEFHGSMQKRALIGRIYSLLTGHSRSLLDLATKVSKRKIRSQHDAGSQTVPIKRIKGSEGRLSDFDCDFNPMQTRTFARWMSVAVARSSGERLPFAELIQLGDDYFVRDGHHRISVARALGEEYVDANVIVLELAPISNALPTLTVTKNLDPGSSRLSHSTRIQRMKL